MPLLTIDQAPGAWALKDGVGNRTRKFRAVLERPCVVPYFLPGIGVVNVLRPESKVLDLQHIANYENLVVCDSHPPQGTSHSLGKGLVLSAALAHDSVEGTIVIHDEELLRKIADGMNQLSPAYLTDYVKRDGEYGGISYQYVQDGCDGGLYVLDHIAVLERGRQGPGVQLLTQDNATAAAIGLAWEEARQLINLSTQTMNPEETPQADPQTAAPVAEPAQTESAAPVAAAPVAAAPVAAEIPVVAAATESVAVETPPVEPAAQTWTEETHEPVTLALQKIAELSSKFDALIAALTANQPKVVTQDAAEVNVEALSNAIELHSQATSLGLATSTAELISDPYKVRVAVAQKLGLTVDSAMNDRDLALVIKGAMTAPRQRQGSATFLESSIPPAQTKRVKTPHPLAGL